MASVAIQNAGPATGPTLVKGARAARTTVFLKLVMAVSGLLFIGFVLGHMYGNLKAFSGEEAFNGYAEHLRVLGEPLLPRNGFLWIARIGLIVALIAHVGSAFALWKRAAGARPVRYQVKKNRASALSSRTMRWGGLTILLFIAWHLINFTIGKVNVSGGPTNNPYQLMVDTFENPAMTAIYLLAMAALGMHLHHGTWSAMQTLGFTTDAVARRRAKAAGWVVAIVVAGGFSLIPLSVVFGLIN